MATTTLTGTTGNDILNAPGSVTTLVAGLDGNDTITLVKGDDKAEGGAGNDSITLNAASINNTVDGGAGADTIYITTAATTFGGSYNMGDGADLVSMTANSNNVSVGGNKGSDTITFGGNIINALVGGGANADSIGFDTAVTNSTVFGGGGKDTINIQALLTNSTIQASDGHDLITTTGATAAFVASIVAAGKGYDSIKLGSAGITTLLGGAGNDTVNVVDNYNGGVIKLGGDDDVVYGSAAEFSGATSIYGGAGNDSIILQGASIVSGTTRFFVDGGAGNDFIGQTATNITGAALTIAGGAGADTIKFNELTDSFNVLGGAGHDSIFVGTANEAVSVNGGSGDDTIYYNFFSAADSASTGSFTAIATLNGGGGNDVIKLNNSFSAGTSGTTALGASGAILNAAYQTGLTIRLSNTLAAIETANWLGTAGTIWVLTATTKTGVSGIMAGVGSASGSVAVVDSGDDLLIAIQGGNSCLVWMKVVDGDEAILTTKTGAVTLTASNFSFGVELFNNANLQLTF